MPSGFGQRLRELWESRGLTQRQLAERVGCSTSTVTGIERGVQDPAWTLAVSLAAALGVGVEAFAGEAGAAPRRGRGRPPARTSTRPDTSPCVGPIAGK